MLTVYAVPVSLYCAKLRILLRHKGLNWREVPPPGGYGSDAYRQVVPSGNLPALLDGSLLIADSEAIAEYLNETHPEPPMLPADPGGRAKARDRSRFHDTRLEPVVRALFPYLNGQPADGAVIDRKASEISARLGQLARILADSDLDRRTLTLGDCGFPVTFEWIARLDPALDLGIAWPEAVLAYRDALERHDAAAAVLVDYRPVLADWMKMRGPGA